MKSYQTPKPSPGTLSPTPTFGGCDSKLYRRLVALANVQDHVMSGGRSSCSSITSKARATVLLCVALTRVSVVLLLGGSVVLLLATTWGYAYFVRVVISRLLVLEDALTKWKPYTRRKDERKP